MAFGISEFKSNLKGGGAKSALFQVNLNYPPRSGLPSIEPSTNAKFLISAASIPASTVGTYDVFYHGKSIKVAADRTFDVWETTIINDEDFGVRKKIEQWMDLLSKYKLNTRSKDLTGGLEGENAGYKQDISVTQFGKDASSLETYKFIGAFPTDLSAITLDWAAGTIETYSCTWSYDRWEN
jgi:hypothetical protein